MTSIAPYPWQQELWQRLSTQLAEGRLGHALLFQGLSGLGQLEFAQQFAAAFLCQSENVDKPCEQCKSCRLFKAEGHPDFQLIEPEGAGKAIKVAQVRELLSSLEQTPQQGRGKCCILAPADAMNANSANALLKSLEEPPGRTLLILLTSAPARLPATIRSRCQNYSFTPPSHEEGVSWLRSRVGDQAELLLKRCQGAPLAAMEWFRDDRVNVESGLREALTALTEGRISALEAAKQLMEPPDPISIDFLLDCMHRAARQGYLVHEGDSLDVALNAIDRALLFRFADKVLHVKSLLLSSANPNRQLLFEELMLDWSAMLRRSDGRKRIPI